MSRYNNRKKGVNDQEMYEKILDDRGVKHLVQYTTPQLKFPDEETLILRPSWSYSIHAI